MQKHYLQDLIEPVVEKAGFELVRVMTIGQANPTLQVMIDVADHSRDLTVDDCADFLLKENICKNTIYRI